MHNEENLKKIARKYLIARKKFREEADNFPELSGNDNIVGRIGEFIALQFIKHRLKRRKATRNRNMSQPGYDIEADGKKVSVKTITAENRTGRTTLIKEPWDELVVIELGADSRVDRIGYLDRENFKKALEEGFLKNRNFAASRSMFNEKGLFDEYGRIYKDDSVRKYL